MVKVRILLLLSVVCLLTVANKTDAYFGPSARPYGMGGAFVALADDVSGVSWNPAGLGKIEGINFGYIHGFPLEDSETSEDAFGYAQDLFGGGIGMNFTIQNLGYYDRVEVGSNGLPNVTGRIPARQFYAVAGYGIEVISSLYLGGSAHLHQVEIGEMTESAFGFDFGGIFSIASVGLDFGLVLDSIAVVSNAYQSTSINPTLGIAYSPAVQIFPRDKWYLVGDVSLFSESARFAIGSEYLFADMVALRLGYETYQSTFDLERDALTAGLGLKIMLFNVDYALIQNEAGDLKHLLSLQMQL